MSLFDKFSMDASAESEGVWLDYGSGGKIRVARAGGGNSAYMRKLEAFYEKHRRQFDLNIMDEDVARTEMISIYADTIVKGFEGITDRDGKELAFNRANVIRLLTELPELFLDIKRAAASIALYREKQRVESAGN